ncbi:MAG: antibiotic biosynthesis monooxygenase [Caldilineaceae bacterium]|nr:antibiotic biosynthesis monooxygenase [Caldilineaceae bacterium]
MYGTVARVKIDPANLEQVRSLATSMDKAPGQIARYVYQMDADPGDLYLVAVFESREAYWANADSPEQHQRYMQLRALLLADPEWHDGEIVDSHT